MMLSADPALSALSKDGTANAQFRARANDMFINSLPYYPFRRSRGIGVNERSVRERDFHFSNAWASCRYRMPSRQKAGMTAIGRLRLLNLGYIAAHAVTTVARAMSLRKFNVRNGSSSWTNDNEVRMTPGSGLRRHL